ncbi:Imidazolonepropionase [Robiginitalea myxolifaciens]|uniref:Imidazolonepropionase n=1 Tax=Robiginitalea myxolifaciens TaxID=400055 RepID=A0A1I6FN25_9FLAO|nr:amidohydrolase family protein [Robiginitalea myxolifaciens]SFR31254.1 Imidazolonepropionase [Robiginitalea myxolifaciens]
MSYSTLFQRALVLIITVSTTLLSCQDKTTTTPDSGQLIENVHIVDVREGTVSDLQHIVIDSGRITAILPQEVETKTFVNRIDGEGAYVVPGLTEMHAHIPSPPTSEERIEATLFLYLAGGVTTIRGMLGHPRHLSLRQEALDGAVLSPRIYTSSPSLNGNSIPDAETAIARVRQYAEEGYDFLKIHPGIKRPVFDSLVRTAKEAGIPFAGHVPVDVGIRHALESGYATIDHVDGYLEGLVPESAGVSPDANGFFGFNFTDLADTAKIAELVALSKERNVRIVPTQSLFERWFAPTTADSLLAQEEMKYMPAATLENWRTVKNQYMEDPAWDPEKWKRFDAIRLHLIAALSAEGPGLLLGSDAPQLFNVPGFSIHHEIDGMQRAGISNAEILRTATLYPAQFFEMESEFGSIAVGKSAEFILVKGNPLEDLDALQELQGVMLRGNWISHDVIQSELARIAKLDKE